MPVFRWTRVQATFNGVRQNQTITRSLQMNSFHITVASVPDREELVAEIFFDDVQVAELNTEFGDLLIELYPRPDRKAWCLDAEQFLQAVVEAKIALLGKGA